MTAEQIKEVLEEHETNYVQKAENVWEWFCTCGQARNLSSWEFCADMTRSHWADKIVELRHGGAQTEAARPLTAEMRHALIAAYTSPYFESLIANAVKVCEAYAARVLESARERKGKIL